MCLVRWILVAANFCIAAAQVAFPDEFRIQEDNKNNNAQPVDVDAQLFNLFRMANSGLDGDTPSSPVGPDLNVFNSIFNQPIGSGGAQPPAPLVVTQAPLLNPDCQDSRQECQGWAQSGECTNNIDYMAPHCKRSCGHCDHPDPDCVNNSNYCTAWQIRGQCQSNPDYMRYNCKYACKSCGETSLPAGLWRDSGAKPPGIEINDIRTN